MNPTLDRIKPVCLVVDDEASIRKTLCLTLTADGWIARGCASFEAAKAAMEEELFDLALVDLRLGAQSGLELLPLLREAQPGLPVIIITAFASVNSAVEAMRLGAVDYLPKPFTPSDVRRAAGQALALRISQRREYGLESQVLLKSKVPAVREILAQARRIAESGLMTLLLRGDAGTGKGVLARAIHDWSPRSANPFIMVACPALPADLLETELFGHAQGLFNGNTPAQKGRVGQAEGGTLFLDEIGELSPSLQVKLLRLIQDKTYERLGENKIRHANVRIIAATRIDLQAAIHDGRFREDLYYHLNVVELRLVPLRERLEDLEGLASNMLGDLRRASSTGPLKVRKDTLERFRKYSWPGNLREMRHVLERAFPLGEGDELRPEHLPSNFGQVMVTGNENPESFASLDEVEFSQIRKVLRASRTLEQAAKILRVDTATLWRKRKKYSL
jgi:NtrC-family two-component system response regulator AlgB